mmetsp:Transcript_29096/g.54428  ORF Transcript_29096/g.54428 Transcript_29096/m.54428 type:complete len:94 (-) Transcript_29096:174-455(-)
MHRACTYINVCLHQRIVDAESQAQGLIRKNRVNKATRMADQSRRRPSVAASTKPAWRSILMCVDDAVRAYAGEHLAALRAHTQLPGWRHQSII